MFHNQKTEIMKNLFFLFVYLFTFTVQAQTPKMSASIMRDHDGLPTNLSISVALPVRPGATFNELIEVKKHQDYITKKISANRLLNFLVITELIIGCVKRLLK